jgi:hypothetical protein
MKESVVIWFQEWQSSSSHKGQIQTIS